MASAPEDFGDRQRAAHAPSSGEDPANELRPAVLQPRGRVAVGDTLNGIYQIERYVGRGGMGEVWEGVNVSSGERVAVKVMLPAFAANPQVQAQFRREARILTRLAHPALAQYRVLAEEPRLGVLYMVTEFIDGIDLTHVLGKVGLADLKALTWRLAAGLRSAHRLGAIHRDMSPDNVRLPDGRLEEAKIIDFGVAKDLQAPNHSVFAGSFVGKLGFAAPELFGAYDREIGPWTDVYSLGLVILAVAQGKAAPMGVTPAEAVDKRRLPVDVSGAPEALQPLLRQMLESDPARRLRSMDEVLEQLGPPTAADAIDMVEPTRRIPLPPPRPAERRPDVREPRRGWLWAGAGGAIAVLLLVGGALLWWPPKPRLPAPPTAAAPAPAQPIAVPTKSLPDVVQAALPALPCSWIGLDSGLPAGGVRLTGVSGAPGGILPAISAAASAAGVAAPAALVDTTQVAPVDPRVCAVLDALRPLRAPAGAAAPTVTATARSYRLERQPDGRRLSAAQITMTIGDPSLDFRLLGLDPSGALSVLISGRKALPDPRVTAQERDSYQVRLGADHTGSSGVLLITGHGAIDDALLTTPAERRDAAWAARLSQAASAGGWRVDMAWYDSVAAPP